MPDFYSLLKALYTKQNKLCLLEVNDMGTVIGLITTLSKHDENIEAIKRVLPYMYYIEPAHLLLLLFYTLPRKAFVPKSERSLTETKEDATIERIKAEICRVLTLSKKDSIVVDAILSKQVTDKQYWSEFFGIE